MHPYLSFTSTSTSTSTPNASPNTPPKAPLTSLTMSTVFVHPGLLHSSADFQRMHDKVKAGEEPWISGWYKLANNSHAWLNYTANAKTIVYRGYDGTHVENYNAMFNDVAAAYALALRWKITGIASYGDKAVSILNQWSGKLTSIQGTADRYLASGIYGYQFANAGEIMRDYAGWAPAELAQFKKMMLDIFYTMNNNFLLNHDGKNNNIFWANWDLCNIASALSIGVFLDNHTIYDQVINYFFYGAGNGAINRTIWHVFPPGDLAQSQESGRDQGHAMLDFSMLGAIAQMAYTQGEDLFGYADNRILKGAEYEAKYNLGYDVPYVPYVDTVNGYNQQNISSTFRGDMRPAWELLWAHYHDLKGLNATYTGLYRDKVRAAGNGSEGGGGNYGPNSGGFDQLGYGTLVYVLTNATNSTSSAPASAAPVSSSSTPSKANSVCSSMIIPTTVILMIVALMHSSRLLHLRW